LFSFLVLHFLPGEFQIDILLTPDGTSLVHRKEEIFVSRAESRDFRGSETGLIKQGDRWTPKPKASVLSIPLEKQMQFFRIIVHCRPKLLDKLIDEPLFFSQILLLLFMNWHLV
jgi:hypothetical protein